MPPKKPAVEKTAPPSPVGSENHDNDSEPAESDAVGSVSTSKVTAHPPAMVMVKNAVKELDSRKGVSSQAIRNSIQAKYPTMELVRLKYMVRKALIKGLETGTLVRPANSTAAATGAQGRFRLAPKKPTDPKEKSETTDPSKEKPKASKAGPKKANGVDKESGTGKKKDSKKQSETTETVKTKKANDAVVSKVAPAKRPKAKRGAINMEASEVSDNVEPKPKEPRAKKPKAKEVEAKEPKAKAPKAAKEPKAKAPKAAKEPDAAEEVEAKEPKAKVTKAAKEKASVKDDKAKADKPKAARRRVKIIE